VQLSVLLPTNRVGPAAISRIAQACSWAGPNIEVIVRDNSGNAQKRELLKHLQYDHCMIIVADPCGPQDNYLDLLKRAKGDFVLYVADDDQCFDRAIAALPSMIDSYGGNPTVAGFTGIYVTESAQGSQTSVYKDIDSDDPVTRATGYLNHPSPLLFYSAQRRELLERIFFFMKSMPFNFSYYDRFYCLLYVLNGKFINLQRLLLVYDQGNWEANETGQAEDVKFYKAAGLDPAIHKLHWFMCAFEGALLAMKSDLFKDIPIAQREVIAARWFAQKYSYFKHQKRLSFGSSLDDEADKLCDKLRSMNGQISIQDALSTVSNFIALSSKTNAQKYFNCWNAVIKGAGQSGLKPVLGFEESAL
jgi:hypothetical protein